VRSSANGDLLHTGGAEQPAHDESCCTPSKVAKVANESVYGIGDLAVQKLVSSRKVAKIATRRTWQPWQS
jgi:hypothetical protein